FRFVFQLQVPRMQRVSQCTSSVPLQNRGPKMFALSEIREIRTLAGNQEPTLVVGNTNLVRSPADHRREQVAGTFVSHPDGASAEEAKTPGLNALVELKCESGSKRHRGEPLL